jgi:hypothetical protein
MLQEPSTGWDIRSMLSGPYLTIVLLVFLFLFLAPVMKLLRRTGHNPLWCLLAIVPAVNLIALWFFAFKPWPSDKPKTVN